MASLAEIRAQYPAYNDMSDQALADRLYAKFYSDMDRAKFDAKVGLAPPALTDTPTPPASPQIDLAAMMAGAASAPPSPAVPQDDLALAPLQPAMSPLDLAHAAYETKGLGEVTGERLRGGVLDVKAGQAALAGVRDIEALQTLQEARRLISEGAGPEAFAPLVGASSRFPLNTLMDPAAVDRAIELFEKRVPAQLSESAKAQAAAAEIPRNPVADAVSQGGFDRATLDTFMKDPLGVIGEFATRSLPQSAPAIVGGVTMGPGGALLGGAQMEAGAAVMEGLRHFGVDPASPDAVRAALANPEIATQLQQYVTARTGPIALMDAATMGLSGALAKKPLQNLASQLVAEPIAEGAGEAAAQVASTGQINEGEILAEIMGGLGSGGAQATATSGVEAVKSLAGRQPSVPEAMPPLPPRGEAPQGMISPPQAPVPPAPQAAPPMAAPAAPVPPQAPVEPQIAPDGGQTSVAAPAIPSQPEPAGAPAVQTRPPAPPAPAPSSEQPDLPTIPQPAEEARVQRQAAKLPKAPVVSWMGALPSDRQTGSTAAARITGIDPAGPVGQELKFAGVTPQRFPKLFKRGGRQDVDNIPFSELPDNLQQTLRRAEDGLYVDRQDVIDAIVEEAAGNPRRTAEEMEILAAARDLEARYEAPNPIGPVEDLSPADVTVPDPEMDLREPMERRESIVNSVRQVSQQAYPGLTLTPQEEAQIADMIDARGGSVDSAINWWLIQEIENVAVDNPTQSEPIPFPEPGEDAGTTPAGDGQAGPVRGPAGEGAAGAGGAGGAGSALPGDGNEARPERGSARTGTSEGGRIDLTPEGEQTVIPGAEKITDKQRGERQMARPMRGGDAPPPEGGLFDEPQDDLFDEPRSARMEEVPDSAFNGDLEHVLTNIFYSDGYKGGRVPLQNFGFTPDEVQAMEQAGLATDGAMSNEQFGSWMDERSRRLSPKKPRKSKADDDIVARGKQPATTKPVTLKDAAEPPKPKRTGPQPRGSLAPRFLDFSFTDKNSVYEAAFRAAGIEPDVARNMNVDDQIAALRKVLLRDYGVKVEIPQRLIKSKSITGREKVTSRERISTRDAIDQMLDAYRQMEMLAHIFGINKKGIGLMANGTSGTGITLSLVNRLPSALGSYSYTPDGSVRTISLPGRSNSFAHEWGHALDHYINTLIKEGDWTMMLSRNIFEEGVQPGTRNNEIGQAFVGVLQALFGQRAGIAAMQISLQNQAAEVNRQGKPTKAAKEAKAALADLEAGRNLPPRLQSKFFKTSKDFDDAFGGGGYFTDPAEMFARAMETFAGVKARALDPSLPTSFLAKPDWAYTASEETRASMTFPRGADAEVLFLAIERLGAALHQRAIFGEGKAARPADRDVYALNQWDHYRPKGSLMERERKEWTQTKRAAENIEKTHPPKRRIKNAGSYLVDTFGGHLNGIIRQQPEAAREGLQNLVDMFVTDPGSGRDTTWRDDRGKVRRTWEEEVQQHETLIMNRFENIVDAHDLNATTDAQLEQLRQMLTGNTPANADPNMVSAAAALRRLMDGEWRYLTEAGVDVGYVRNGHLPRIVDIDAVAVDRGGFTEQAQKVYREVFNDDVRSVDELEDQITDVRRIINMIEGDTVPASDGGRIGIQRFSQSDLDMIETWRKALKKYRRAVNEMNKAIEADNPKAGDFVAKMEQAQDAFEDLMGDMHDMLEDRWSLMAAEHWRQKILTGSPNDIDGLGPNATFTKKRTLPASADRLMADYYHGDPMTLISKYIHTAARRAEWVRRVGKDGERMENMLGAAAEAGVDRRDIDEVRRLVQMLAGRQDTAGQSDLSWIGGWGYVLATITLLSRATISSLHEAMVISLKTGRTRDSFTALAKTFGHLLRTSNARDRREMARIVGLVRSAMNETVMMNRYGGDLDPNQKQAKTLSEFFRRMGLTALTNVQRAVAANMGADHIRRQLQIDAGQIKPFFSTEARGRKLAHEELNDLGIPKEHRAALLEWLESFGSQQPTVDDLLGVDGDYFNDAAAIWAGAVMRFADTTIQNPRKYTRPAAAQDSHYRAIYGITGFIFGFQREIINPLLKRGVDARRDGESKAHALARQTIGASRNAAVALPSLAAIYSGVLLTSALREAIFNRDGWDEAEEEDRLAEWLMEGALYRTGYMGAFDIPWQQIRRRKWDKDMAALYAGPHRAFFLDKADVLLDVPFGRNSPNTDTTERRAAESTLDALLSTGVNFGLSYVPGGPITRPLYGAAMYSWDALSPAEILAEEMYPDD